ncbi:putative cell survival pathways protein [Blastocladiella emersonii ATCC 22665]|nr:putative cell survival pathways protein [Blastocladiella emersonii ATCC 22665]
MLAQGTCVKSPAPVVSNTDLAWLKQGSGYSEAQTFYITPASGGLVYVQVAYSEVSVSPLAQVTVRVATPAVSFFKSFNNSGSALKVAADGVSATCNDYSVTKQGDNLLVALRDKEVVANLTVALTRDNTLQVGDGKIHFAAPGAGKPDGFLLQTFGVRGVASGVLMANGTTLDLAGAATVVQQHQGISPHKIATQWNFFTFSSANLSLSTISGTTPSTYQAEKFGTVAANVRGESAVAAAVELEFPSSAVDPSNSYAVPKEFMLTTTLSNGHTVEASAPLDFARVNRIDVLGQLPWLVRKAVQYFVSKPFVYQFVETAHVVVRDAAGNVVVDESASAMFEVSFTNPPN